MKVRGAEWKAFYSDDEFWPEGVYHDDDDIAINGVSGDDIDTMNVKDEDIVSFTCGYMMFEARGQDLPKHLSECEFKGSVSLITYFKRWQKLQKVRYVTIEIDVALYDDVVKKLKDTAGVKVL